MVFKAEYIWIDGAEPTRKLRSKTRILEDGAKPAIWGFDGSSTNQATGENSDCAAECQGNGPCSASAAPLCQEWCYKVHGMTPRI